MLRDKIKNKEVFKELTKFDLKQILKENSDDIIDKVFIAREDSISNIEKPQYKRLEKLIQKKTEFQNNLENIPETFEKTKSKVLQTFTEYTELINEMNAYTNEEYYKKGFKDGINLIIEAITKD